MPSAALDSGTPELQQLHAGLLADLVALRRGEHPVVWLAPAGEGAGKLGDDVAAGIPSRGHEVITVIAQAAPELDLRLCLALQRAG